LGERAASGGYGSVAMGLDAIVSPVGSYGIAIGGFARTSGRQAMAIGYRANANQANSLALGPDTVADMINATAIGYLANTSANNQLMLGGAGSSIAIGDIGASNAAQVGPELVLTIDSAGTIGFSNPSAAQSLARSGAIAAVSGSGMEAGGYAAVIDPRVDSLAGRVALLERRVGGYDLRMQGLEGGVASAMAMGGVAPIPGRKFTVTVAGAGYGGQQALAGMLGGWVGEDVFVSAAVSGNTGDRRVGARVAASVGF